MYITSFIVIILSFKVVLAFCNNNLNETFEDKVIKTKEHVKCEQKNSLNNEEIITLNSSSSTEKSLQNKLKKKETKKKIKAISKRSKPIKKRTLNKKRLKVQESNDDKFGNNKKVREKAHKQSLSEESKSSSKSESEDSEEPKFQLGEGETLLDFSALAKIKSLDIDHDSQMSSQVTTEMIKMPNPLLNWNCSSLSLEEEQNISTGYLDKRISHMITHAEDFPDGGTQLLEDMRHYYCYLKHVNQLVIDQVRRGKALMKQLVEEDPEFTQIGFDTDELTEQFCWVKEEAEGFEQIMDGICYQWKCLVARLKH